MTTRAKEKKKNGKREEERDEKKTGKQSKCLMTKPKWKNPIWRNSFQLEHLKMVNVQYSSVCFINLRFDFVLRFILKAMLYIKWCENGHKQWHSNE